MRVIEADVPIDFAAAPRQIEDALADRLLDVLSVHVGGLDEPPLHDERHDHEWRRSTAEAARVLLKSGGACAACRDRVNLQGADARDLLKVHLVGEAANEDRSAALCVECLNEMTESGFTRFVDYRFALHPRCPRCEANRTCTVVYGMPPSPWWLADEPWSTMGGCDIRPDSDRWFCSACGYGWRYDVDPRFRDASDPRGDHVTARLFNFDGRRTHMQPPDVDDPDEIQIGTLVIEDVSSAWGEYTRYVVRCEDGCIREIEPDTILRGLGR